MSEIPYYFDTPSPRYFRETGWFKNPKSRAFISWCFERCSSETHEISHDGQRIILKPYQFIFGRFVCSEETGLTEDEVRTQQLSMEKAGYLKKAPNKTPKRFTIYEWSTAVFLKSYPQVKPQLTPKSPPSNPHKPELRTIDIKKPPPNPHVSDSVGGFFKCLEEDSRLSEDDKLRIMELNLPEDRVLLAIAYSKIKPANTTILRQIIWHCRLKIPPVAQKSFWDSFRDHFENQKKYNGALCHLNCETVAFERGITHRQVYINKAGSKEEVEKILSQFGIAWSYDNH